MDIKTPHEPLFPGRVEAVVAALLQAFSTEEKAEPVYRSTMAPQEAVAVVAVPGIMLVAATVAVEGTVAMKLMYSMVGAVVRVAMAGI